MADQARMPYPGYWAAVFCLVAAFFSTDVGGTTFLYKQYLIRQDSGQEILCEPYQVRQDDWIYKIFRRKGEISEEDFPRFLQIFERLNSHIGDLDHIQVGERILIPLRVMAAEADSTEDATDDVLTLPFVTVSKALPGEVPSPPVPSPRTHTVQPGDTVHRLIATQFGPPGSREYEPALARFKKLNPQIEDLDRIYTGQVIRLPSPDLLQSLEVLDAPSSAAAPVESSIMDLKPETQPGRALPGGQATVLSGLSDQAPIEMLAALLGGSIRTQGKYHFPLPNKPDVVIDTAKSPVLELPSGERVLMVNPDEITAADMAEVQRRWSDFKILSMAPQNNDGDLLGQLLKSYGAVQAPPSFILREPGLTLTARVNWILENQAAVRSPRAPRTGLTLLTETTEQTPPAVQRYFAAHGLNLREIVSRNGDMRILPFNAGLSTFIPGKVLPAADGRKLMIELLQTMGFVCAPHSQVKFTYGGMELSAWADLVQNKDEQQILLNFGQIQGDAIAEIEKSGLQIVDLPWQLSLRDRLVALFQALDVSCTYDPVFWAATRPATYNISITATGLLASPLIGRQFLITPFAYSVPALQIFHERGIQVIQLEMRAAERKAAGWD